MHIGSSIRIVRKGKYMSQVTLADKARITQAALSQIELGNARPGIKTLAAISKALETPEAVLHLMAIDKSDFPKGKRELFEALWPTMKDMLWRLCV
jgi:transcriptional regulator with XRE-family HTH domain